MSMARGLFYLRLAQHAADRAIAPARDHEATPQDRAMMQRALQLAREAAAIGEVPVGAVVYRGDEVVGEGFNRREVDQDPSAHAEHIAMLEASRRLGSWRLDGCTLVVTLEPCAMCAGLIVNARVPRVVYGASDPKAGFAGSLGNLLADERLNHRVRPIAGVAGQESRDLLKRFFADLRKDRRKRKR
jgi:tRNA(adenine34) deaminase